MAWQNIPAVLSLRDEFNRLAPDRAIGADGTVGDLAHQERTSDHNPDETGSVPIHDADHVNEVHALDITTDLRVPGLSMETVVQFLLARCRSGAEKRLRYIIFNRRIWSAEKGWMQRAYTLDDPHTGHTHFSFSYDSKREADASSWHLEDIPVALTADDKKWISGQIDAAKKAVLADVAKVALDAATRVWNTKFQRPGEEPGKMTSAGAYQSWTDIVTDRAADRVIAELSPKLDQVLAAVAVPPAQP